MTQVAPMPDFTPAQPSRCAHCGNAHHTEMHPVLEVLNRQTELLAVLTGILEPKRYKQMQEALEDGTGKATAIFTSWPGGVNKLWLVERTVVSTTSTGTPIAGVYVLDALPSVQRAASGAAVVPQISNRYLENVSNVAINADDNGISPVLVKGSEVLVVQWTGLSAGAVCTARIQVRLSWQSTD